MRGVKVWVKTEREGEIGRGDKGRGVLWGVEPRSSPQGTAPSGTAQQQERRFGPFQLARLIGLTKNKPVSKWEPALVAEYPLRWRAGLPLAGKNKWEGYIKRMMSGTECSLFFFFFFSKLFNAHKPQSFTCGRGVLIRT